MPEPESGPTTPKTKRVKCEKDVCENWVVVDYDEFGGVLCQECMDRLCERD